MSFIEFSQWHPRDFPRIPVSNTANPHDPLGGLRDLTQAVQEHHPEARVALESMRGRQGVGERHRGTQCAQSVHSAWNWVREKQHTTVEISISFVYRVRLTGVIPAGNFRHRMITSDIFRPFEFIWEAASARSSTQESIVKIGSTSQGQTALAFDMAIAAIWISIFTSESPLNSRTWQDLAGHYVPLCMQVCRDWQTTKDFGKPNPTEYLTVHGTQRVNKCK